MLPWPAAKPESADDPLPGFASWAQRARKRADTLPPPPPTISGPKNRLVYPIYGERIYFNETLTPTIIAYKN